jgi:hypothetical protein
VTKEEAIKEAEGRDIIMRSCWECNGAHDHLRRSEFVVFCLWGCGRYWWKGVEVGHSLDVEATAESVMKLSDLVDVRIEMSPAPASPFESPIWSSLLEHLKKTEGTE